MPDRLILPLRSKIAAGLLTAVLVLVVGVISWWAVKRATKSSDDLSHTGQVLLEQHKLLAGLTDVETAARGYAITADSTFLRPFDDARLAVPASIARLRLLTSDHPAQRRKLDSLESYANQHVALNTQIIQRRDSDGFGAAPAH